MIAVDQLIGMLAPSLKEEQEQPYLYERFHENSKLHRFPDALSSVGDGDPNKLLNREVQQIEIAEVESAIAAKGKQYQAAERRSLPDSLEKLQKVSLLDAMSKRTSGRAFRPEPVTWKDLSALLNVAYGWNDERQVERGEDTIDFRFVPSAGRLYPLEIYLSTPSDDEDICNLWHYEPNDHSLARILRPKVEELHAVLAEPPAPPPPTLVFVTGVLPRLSWKYDERAYRYALMEAGHVGQNLQLAATALGLSACPVASFYDDAVHDLLGVDGVTEVVLYCFFLGHASDGDKNSSPHQTHSVT